MYSVKSKSQRMRYRLPFIIKSIKLFFILYCYLGTLNYFLFFLIFPNIKKNTTFSRFTKPGMKCVTISTAPNQKTHFFCGANWEKILSFISDNLVVWMSQTHFASECAYIVGIPALLWRQVKHLWVRFCVACFVKRILFLYT